MRGRRRGGMCVSATCGLFTGSPGGWARGPGGSAAPCYLSLCSIQAFFFATPFLSSAARHRPT